MSSSVTLFENVLPLQNSPTQNYRPPFASPPADRQHIRHPPVQGSNFTGAAGTSIQFRLPSINKLLASDAGVRFGFKLKLDKPAQSFLSVGASSIIQSITVETTSGHLIERLDNYAVWARLNSNITVPEWHKTTALGICSGYAPQLAVDFAASPGRGDGHYEVQLHSMMLSNAKDLPLKHIGGLVINIQLASASAALVRDPAITDPASYTLTEAYLAYDTIELSDGGKAEMDAAFRAAGGVFLSGRSWVSKSPQFTNPSGTIVISDRHSSQTGFVLVFRNNAVFTNKNMDQNQFVKCIDSAHVRNGGEMLSAMPLRFPTNEGGNTVDVTEAFGNVLQAYGNHTIGQRLNYTDFSDTNGAKEGPLGNGSFCFVQSLETSHLVSGSAQAKRSGVDIEVVTTGPPLTGGVSYSCTAFLSFNQVFSANIDGSYDVFC